MRRRLLTFAVLAAVAAVLLVGAGSAGGHPPLPSAASGSDEVVEAAEAVAKASTLTVLHDVEATVGSPTVDLPSPLAGAAAAEHDSPCVVRADCAGALVVAGLGFVLALPVMTPSVGVAAAPTSRVAGSARLLRSMLWATRLHRPPQAS